MASRLAFEGTLSGPAFVSVPTVGSGNLSQNLSSTFLQDKGQQLYQSNAFQGKNIDKHFLDSTSSSSSGKRAKKTAFTSNKSRNLDPFEQEKDKKKNRHDTSFSPSKKSKKKDDHDDVETDSEESEEDYEEDDEDSKKKKKKGGGGGKLSMFDKQSWSKVIFSGIGPAIAVGTFMATRTKGGESSDSESS